MTVIPDKEARCRRIEGLIAEGRGVVEACREVGGISERTFARWRRAKSAAPVARRPEQGERTGTR